jgi:hypothetical protein
MANAMLSALQMLGVETNAFGDSSGTMELNSAPSNLTVARG